MTAGSMRRAAARVLMGAVVAAFGVALVASPASAHNYLVSSTPAAGETVTTQPGTFSVTTNDNLLDIGGDGTGFAIQISGPSDAPLYYGDGCASVLGPTVSTEAQLGAAGEYTVVWQVVSTDGHPKSDSFTFAWAPDAGQTLADGSATAPDCNGTMSTGSGSGSGSGAGAGSGDDDATDASESGASAEAGIALGDILWIGGALVAVLVAGVVTVLILRRKQA